MSYFSVSKKQHSSIVTCRTPSSGRETVDTYITTKIHILAVEKECEIQRCLFRIEPLVCLENCLLKVKIKIRTLVQEHLLTV